MSARRCSNESSFVSCFDSCSRGFVNIAALSGMGQGLSPAMKSSVVSEQSEAIRTAASRFVRTLAPERQGRIIYPFPSHETPTMAKFARQGGPGGPGGGPGGSGAPVGQGRPGGPSNPRWTRRSGRLCLCW